MENQKITTRKNMANYQDFIAYVEQFYYVGWAAQMAKENPDALQFEYDHFLDIMNCFQNENVLMYS